MSHHRMSRPGSERGGPRVAGLDAVIQLAALVTSPNDRSYRCKGGSSNGQGCVPMWRREVRELMLVERQPTLPHTYKTCLPYHQLIKYLDIKELAGRDDLAGH